MTHEVYQATSKGVARAFRALAPGAAIAVALAGEEHGWGLFNAVDASAWVAIPLSVVLLDLVIYFQHVHVPCGADCRLHRVHHMDLVGSAGGWA